MRSQGALPKNILQREENRQGDQMNIRRKVAALYVAATCAAAMCYVLPAFAYMPGDLIDEVVVNGDYPTPALWKVTKSTEEGDHVLWILGTLEQMPMTAKWNNGPINKIMAESQEIIASPGMSIGIDGKVGIFKMLTLVPTVLKARKNPNGKELKELIPPDLYARWLALKLKYIGKSSGIEEWRPMFAAEELKSKVMERWRDSLPKSERPSKKRKKPESSEPKIKRTVPMLSAKIPSKELRSSIKAFAKSPIADTECFAAVIALVESWSDTQQLSARANAWSRGDIATLRQLPPPPDDLTPCEVAMVGSQVVQDFHFEGFDDIAASLRQRWVEAADSALTNNRSTYATLPINKLIHGNYLDELRRRGYTVEEPT
jgi:hypothetical protein